MTAKRRIGSPLPALAKVLDWVPTACAAVLGIAALQQVFVAFTEAFLFHVTVAAFLGVYAWAIWRTIPIAVASFAGLLTLYLPLYLFVEISSFAYVTDLCGRE